jgi:hypothetical protein
MLAGSRDVGRAPRLTVGGPGIAAVQMSPPPSTHTIFYPAADALPSRLLPDTFPFQRSVGILKVIWHKCSQNRDPHSESNRTLRGRTFTVNVKLSPGLSLSSICTHSYSWCWDDGGKWSASHPWERSVMPTGEEAGWSYAMYFILCM